MRATAVEMDNRLLSRMLEKWCIEWKLSDDAVRTLARMIVADSNNETAKTRIKLHKIMKVLCRDDVIWEFGVLVPTLRAMDDLLYSILGHKKERLTLFEYLDPRTSPLVVCAGILMEHLVDWSLDNPRWV